MQQRHRVLLITAGTGNTTSAEGADRVEAAVTLEKLAAMYREQGNVAAALPIELRSRSIRQAL